MCCVAILRFHDGLISRTVFDQALGLLQAMRPKSAARF
jgi:hypothetical protein